MSEPTDDEIRALITDETQRARMELRTLLLIIRESLMDPEIPPEQLREISMQLLRLCAKAVSMDDLFSDLG